MSTTDSTTPRSDSGASSPVLTPSSPPSSISTTSTASATPTADPAAIIGLACRVPGAQNPSQLWKLIAEQKDVQSKIPADRFNVDAFYHPDGTNKGTTNAKYGYFLDQDISQFDAGFFNISGKEAEAMDPQQRLLLEVVYEALEDAGITLAEIGGSQASVFCGCFTNDYNAMTTKDLEYYPKYTVTGTGNAILSNRISYFYDLHGPSATIDTACSSSLVCFHLGSQSLQNREADISIVIGSALHFDPNIFITMTDLGMLSTDGRCRAFDASGRGYVRGEGVCAAILKRKSHAELDGDNIRAIVRSTCTNHDGKKQGITLPSSEAQESLIRRAYANANLDPAHTQYFEAHGTGTPAGDPRETRAIGAVFGPKRDSPLYVGSIKTNIGHLEGASGLAGVIKATLALQAGQIPPNMHFNNPNPSINFDDWKIKVPTKMINWKAPNGLRRASVNSFGYGGTNAHVILEGYNPPKRLADAKPAMPGALVEMVLDRPYLTPLTSHSDKAGKLLAANLAHYLEKNPGVNVLDLAYGMSIRRSMHQQRSFAIGNDTGSMVKDLINPQPLAAWTVAKSVKPRLGFVFTGQGGQWFAMGRNLLEQSPIFKQTLEKCDTLLQSLHDAPEWSIVDELRKSKDTSRLSQTRFSQPICTALQLAILALLKEWAIEPAAVVGHSSGEMAAAYAAGILSFKSTIVAAYYRGLYMSNGAENATTVPGSMMAIGLTEPQAVAELKSYSGRIAIAAINSPSSITVSGDEDAISELKDSLTTRKIFARQLQVAQAFHSHHMFPLAPAYQKALESHSEFTAMPPKVRMFSSVTARVADHEKMGASYWTANMTGAVRFSDALTGILLDDLDEQNVDVLVEIGPHPALKGPTRQVVQSLKLDVPYVASLTRGVPDYEGLLATAGQLFTLGYPVDLTAVNADHFITDEGSIAQIMTANIPPRLPSYSWNHAKYWSETRFIKEHRLRESRHAILGAPVPGSPATAPRWRNYLRQSELPWLREHMIDGKVIFPAAGYISMAIEAIARVGSNETDLKCIALRDIAVKSALIVADSDMGTEVILELRPASISAKSTSDVWHEFVIFSFDETDRCNEHCRGLISIENGSPAPIERIQPCASVEELQESSDRCIPVRKYYERLHSLGLQYGENFRLLSGNIESGPGFATAPLVWNPKQLSAEASNVSILHPALLDASIHVVFAAIESRLGRPVDESFIPTFVRSMKVSGAFNNARNGSGTQSFHASSVTSLPGPRVAVNDLRLHSEDKSQLLIDIQGLELTALGEGSASDGPGRSLFFRTRWQPAFDFLGTSIHEPTFEGISDVLDVFAHQHPDCQILHLTAGLDSSRAVLRTLGGTVTDRRRFRKLTPYSFNHSAESLKALGEERPGLIDFSVPADEEYDVVVLSEPISSDPAAYLKDGGIVISDGVSFDTEGLTKLWESRHFGAWRKNEAEAGLAGDLTLVMSSSVSPQTEVLATILESSHEGPVRRIPLSKITQSSDVSDNVAVLVNLDTSLFFDESMTAAEDYDAVQKLLTSTGKNIVWVLEGAQMDCQRPEHAMILGLARTARSEQEQLRLVILDVTRTCSNSQLSERIIQVFDPRIKEDEIVERDGTLHIARVEADDALNSKVPNGFHREAKLERFGQGQPLALKIGKVGLLETLVFGEDEEVVDSDLGPDDLEIEVKASAINFRDIAASMGIIDDYKLGDECAGIVVRKGANVVDGAFEIGDRVVAWRPGQGAHRSIVRNPATLCYRLTGAMPFSTAAAIPCILTTAYYALRDVARLRPGETVLIHSAAGGVGQMAVQIAQMIGANVIATVGSQGKRDFLKNRLGLRDDQMFSSRDDSFLEGVMKVTNGRGVDVALNSLAGKLLHTTWACITHFGRFIEIGKRDIHENSKIDMEPFRKSVTFASVDLITMFERNKTLGARVFQDCCKLVHEGAIRPPEPITEHSYAEAQKAFRLLQMGKHTGKVVLVPDKDDVVPVQPRTYRGTKLFDPAKTYLLVGGLGGLGRTLAEWLVRKGAKGLAFLSRTGPDRPEARATLDWLRTRNIRVSIHRGDVTDFVTVKSVIDSLGQDLAGIFQAAMVLKDAPLDQMTFKQWQACVSPKVRGTYNLHKATTHTPLDFFVCFSSVSDVVGSKAQANYAAANCYLDALMRHRRELGLKGTTMNCGMIVGVGAVAENAELQKVMERLGYDAVNEEELLYQIEEAVNAEAPFPGESRGIDAHQIITGLNLAREDLYWAPKPLFRNLYSNHDFQGGSAQADTGKNLSGLLKAATDLEERTSLLLSAFIDKVAAVLAVAADTIQATNPLSAYGLDSIVAVEFRKWFAKTISVELALFDVLGSKSIGALVSKAAGLMVLDTPVAIVQKEKAMAEDSAAKATSASGELTSHPSLSSDIVSVQMPDHIPMSTFQRRLWFAHNLVEDRSFLNLPIICHMKGKPDFAALRTSMEEIKRRNDILRTSYLEGDEFAEQKLLDDFTVDLSFEDLSSQRDSQEALNTYVSSLRHLELDIEEGQNMRVSLAQLADDSYALILIVHHISADRGSTKSFLEQFTAIYDGVRAGSDLGVIPRPRLSYADFTIWHQERLASPLLQNDVRFWKEKLTGCPSASQLLPFARAERPTQNDYQRAVHEVTLGSAIFNRMKRVCARMGTTPFQFLLTAFRSFIYRYTEEEDLTILMIDGNRPHPDVDDTLGFFVNMIPVRCTQTCDTSFDHLLEGIKDLTLEALEHSRVPFDAIVDAIGTKKNPSHFPVGQIVVNYQMHGQMPRYPTSDFEIHDVTSEDIPTACDLALEAFEDPVRGLKLNLQYSSTLYHGEDMDRFLDNFQAFLTSAVKDHRQPIAEMPMCGEKEIEHLRANYWATELTKNTWNDMSVMDRFFAQAQAQPEAVAIKTSEGIMISYGELADKAQRIGHSLKQAGASPGQFIGLYSRPGIRTVAAMMGILLNRCGYVSMDPTFAADRLAFMAADSNIDILMYDLGLLDAAQTIVSKASPSDSSFSPRLIEIEKSATNVVRLGPAVASGEDPFYTIYTSGSTGKPKGVVLRQSNTQQMLSTLHHDYDFSVHDRFLSHSSICFDLSVVQIWSALTAGATLCLASTAARNDPVALVAFMQQSGVTVTYFTPTQFALLLEHARDTLRQCTDYRVAYFAGERLPVRLAKAFYDLGTPATLYNTWSPSELVVQTTIHTTAYPAEDNVNIPIGSPMANCPHYIMDARLNPLPAGLVGEICVGGAQVGAGYLNRPEANAKSFVEDAYCSAGHRDRGWTRMFRTGDKGRFQPDGQLEFHGRIAGDKQIKLRGFRIDLGEVEHRIFTEAAADAGAGLIDVSMTARVVGKEGSDLTDDRQLIAFIVPKHVLSAEQKKAFAISMQQRLRKHLNAYMLPNAYQFLDNLPVTIGGKVDRQNLLTRELQLTFPSPVVDGTTTDVSHESVDDKVLKTITDIFRDVLKLAPNHTLTPNDNFFELGGQSILLLRLQAKMKRVFKVVPTLPELFKTPTPAGVSETLRQKLQSKSAKVQKVEDVRGKISWAEEATLPNERRYIVPYGIRSMSRLDVSNILITGVESYVGLHMLATWLASRPTTTVFLLGSQQKTEHAELISSLDKYGLFDESFTRETFVTRTQCVSGTLAETHFGLDSKAFKDLGRSVHAIYHLGGQVSLLKSYSDLRRLNVTAALDVIELAGYGEHQTEIHHLSTWSVPHLQTWSTAKRTEDAILTTEESAAHFSPPETDEYGYFKSRWVSEMLMSQAADRGFSVSIYRASAVTASTITRVAEPADDFIRRMILGMIESGAVPQVGVKGEPEFSVDFVPVDYLTTSILNLSTHNQVRSKELSILHIGNETPLPLSRLPALMGQVRPDATHGRTLPLDDWLKLVSANESADAQLRWAVLKDYLEAGHVMFSLERGETRRKLELVGAARNCPPVDGSFLRDMFGMSR
ncbi:MAG: putative Hybrid PKS-NRPS biosynthetic cluster [Caeruleum heppii]|nr:MAG: putative Hybrid PKS-NRPS biosynthetic cluster [Caeruleum heppii]